MGDEYNLSSEVLSEITNKKEELASQLGETIPDVILEEMKQFHLKTRNDKTVVKHFIHKKEKKIYNEDFCLPLIEYLNKYEGDEGKTDMIWQFLHIIYMLLENAYHDSNNEILAALINKIELHDNLHSASNESKAELPDNVTPPDLEKLTSLMSDLNMIMKSQGLDLPNMMQPSDVSLNKNILKDIIKDVKENITKNGDDLDNLIESTKEIGKKYEEKITSGELTLNELVSSMMGIMTDPNELKETFNDIDPSKLPDPEKIINKMMSQLGKDTLPANETAEMSSLMNSLINGQKADFNPMKLLERVVADMKNVQAEEPLTDEQLKEMEEFYSKINLG